MHTYIRTHVRMHAIHSQHIILLPSNYTGAIVALAGSLGKLKIIPSDLPRSFPLLLNSVCSLSSSFDRRTFVTILRSLTVLSVRWNVLTPEQQIGVAAGNYYSFLFHRFD